MPYKSLIASILVLGFASAVMAAGSQSSSTRASARPSKYDEAVKAVERRDYRRALSLLDGVTKAQPRNADAWNYVGFSHRQLKEYDQALAAYEKALAIDAKHRGANEYLGELYLKMGDVAKAKERLEVLNKACSRGCEEYDDLKAAIDKYDAG